MHVSKRGGSDYVIGFPLTGRVVDLDGGIAEPDRNIRTFPFNDTPAQHWKFVRTGDNAVVNGKTLSVYFIQTVSTNHGDNEQAQSDALYCIMASGNPPGQGSNVKLQIQNAEYNWKGKFVFSPVPSVPNGAYKIAPYLSGTAVLGVAGHSKANGASCVLEANVEDSNWQVFVVDSLDDGTASIRCVEHGFSLDVSYSQNTPNPKNNDNLILWPWHAGVNQKWVVKYCAQMAKRNNEDMPLYKVINQWGNDQYVIDVNGNKSTPNTNVRIWQMSNSRNNPQSFWFDPTEAYDKKLTVPSEIVGSVNGNYGALLGSSGASTVYPAWRGSGEAWKVRYRTRKRTVDKANNYRTAWSAWKSLDQGVGIYDGWDVAGVPTATAVLGDGRYTASEGVSFTLGNSGTAADLVDVEFEVRQLSAMSLDWTETEVYSHSGSAAKVCTVAYKPTLTIGAVNIKMTGAEVTYTSTFHRSSNKVHIWVDGLFDTSGNGIGYTGTLKSSKILRVPESNEEVTVKWSITTVDGITVTGSQNVNLVVAFAGAPEMTCTTNLNQEMHLLEVTTPAGTTDARLWMTLLDQKTIEGYEEVVEIEKVSSRVFKVPYPLTGRFLLFVAAIVNNVMKVWFTTQVMSMNDITRLWNFGDTLSEYCIGTWAMDTPPEESVDTTKSNDDRPTTSGTWNRVRFGNVLSQSRSITAIAMDDIDKTGRSKVKALSTQKYAWYRNPEGEVVRVAIISVNEVRKYYGSEFTVEMRRVDANT